MSLFLFADGSSRHRAFADLPAPFVWGDRAAVLAAAPTPVRGLSYTKGRKTGAMPLTADVYRDEWKVGGMTFAANYKGRRQPLPGAQALRRNGDSEGHVSRDMYFLGPRAVVELGGQVLAAGATLRVDFALAIDVGGGLLPQETYRLHAAADTPGLDSRGGAALELDTEPRPPARGDEVFPVPGGLLHASMPESRARFAADATIWLPGARRATSRGSRRGRRGKLRRARALARRGRFRRDAVQHDFGVLARDQADGSLVALFVTRSMATIHRTGIDGVKAVRRARFREPTGGALDHEALVSQAELSAQMKGEPFDAAGFCAFRG
ncbi:hypothetical protein [Nannocystis pusilla]|uniref:hypothetical protein n=1 Tax=Nannocystis pusilla TaxID=889268 RepID=UPI003B7E02E3